MRKNRWVLAAVLLPVLLLAAGCKETESTTVQTETPPGESVGERILATEDPVTIGEFRFSHKSGCYQAAIRLTILTEEKADIYYTTDGSNPLTSETAVKYDRCVMIEDPGDRPNVVSAVSPDLFDTANARRNAERTNYISSVSAPSDDEVDKCNVISVAAVYPDGTTSEVVTNTYFIGDMADHIQGLQESCEAAGTDLMVISMTMDYDDLFDPDTGIYVKGTMFEEAVQAILDSGESLKNDADAARRMDANYNMRGREWERATHIDIFEAGASDTTCVLQQNCGVRVQGNYSRSDLQKGFRFYARNEYSGDKNFNYALFGEDATDEKGETLEKFKTFILRNGGNCAFTTKWSDTYWQSLLTETACSTLCSRPAILYINGEYWGLYVMQEDYSADYFEDHYGVDKETVVLYKADAEKYESGYKLDLGDAPEGESDSYYYADLMNFFALHRDLKDEAAYDEFCMLVDPDSVLDYFAAELWINNKWDWPGKNWSMWRTTTIDESNPYADGRFRFTFYDMEFGGVSGASDASTNTIKEDNYKTYGMLDRNSGNIAVKCFFYLMSNEDFRADFVERLTQLSENEFEKDAALERLDYFKDVYEPLYDQFFARYDDIGSREGAVNGGYASYKCIYDFLQERENYIYKMVDFIDDYYENHYQE